MMAASTVERAFLAACRAELSALKPGNVHVFAAGHGMTVKDFERSAEAAAAPLARRGERVGRRLLEAVMATREAVGQNTNLGILLLCAPLARAADVEGVDLRESLARVLSDLDREDAELAFQAIALASPGGLGSAPRHDVREKASCTLREAMAEAAPRDRIAQAYGDNFAEIFEVGIAAARSRARQEIAWWPATSAYLAFLRRAPDSHILRKRGKDMAEHVRDEADSLCRSIESIGSVSQVQAKLLEFDGFLKGRGLNPGTCADLTVATLFAARLQRILRELPESGSLARGEARASLLSGQPVRRHAGC